MGAGAVVPMMIMSMAMTAGSAVMQGVQANNEANAQADAEKRDLTQRLDARLQKVMALRGAQRVAMGATDLSLASPTFGSIEADRQLNFNIENQADKWSTANLINRLQGRGRTALIAGGMSAGADLLKGAYSAADYNASRPAAPKTSTAINNGVWT